jgi:tetratricopeptide (TPR) repeat protein/SAM-dependent methyltransferase
MNRADRRRQKKLGGSGAVSPAKALQAAFEDAVRHHEHGRLREAENGYRQILNLAPGHPDALHLIGVVRHQSGDPQAAEHNIKQALKAQNRNPAYHRSLGKVFHKNRRHDEAIRCFHTAVQLDPHYVDAHNDLGTAYWELSRVDDAVACFQRVLELDAKNVSANNNLGLALKDRGDIDAAVKRFKIAADSDPRSVEVQNNLGLMLQYQGEREAALAAFRTAIRLDPKRTGSWINFAEALRFARIDNADPDLEQDIIDCFGQDRVNRQRLAVSAIGLLRLNNEFAAVLNQASGTGNDVSEILTSQVLGALNHRLLIAMLWHAVIPDFDFERLLTRTRRAILDAVLSGDLVLDSEEFVFALSANCFTNEYVYAVSDEEIDGVASLIGHLPEGGHELTPDKRILWAVVGCYRPLHTILGAERLEEFSKSVPGDGFGDLVRRQMVEPREEAALKQTIGTLSPVVDSVSQIVRQQYEENPYPRWRTVNAGRARPLLSVVRQLFPHATGLPETGSEQADILIAGCGTGQTAVQASYRFTEPNILAVDLSRTSLAFAMRQAREFDIGSIEFVHGDILDLETSERSFDFIEAAGVLHHMADPLVGWRILRGLLRPGGFMKVALYSEFARRHVAAARAFVKSGDYSATPDGIRQCRQDIFALPRDSEVREVAGSLDFHAMSPCRDLIFHVQERSYTLPEIAEMLEPLKLRFIGFELRDRTVQTTYRERFPNDTTLSDLSNWHDLESAYPDTFAGMYQFWLRAGDS